MFNFLPHPLDTIVPFVIVLGALVFFHELGHYLAARWRGVFVDAFSIGFGQSIASWRDRSGTVWKLGWIPLGGYVKLHGQERPEDVSDEVRATWRPGQTFQEKSILSRAIIVVAGPVANFILAIVIFAVLFGAFGEPVLPDVIPPVVGQVAVGSAAAHGGLQSGDRIESINGQAVVRFDDIRQIVAAHPGESMTLLVHRGATEQTIGLTTDSKQEDGKTIGVLGINAGAIVTYRPLSLPQAAWMGVTHTWDLLAQSVSGLWSIITGSTTASALGGPLRIASLAGQAAEQGPGTLLNLLGFLSVSIGLVNLFPIPILDGGHLLLFALEAVRGRPLPQRAVEYGFRAGLAVLVGLFVFVTSNDLANLGVIHWVKGLFG